MSMGRAYILAGTQNSFTDNSNLALDEGIHHDHNDLLNKKLGIYTKWLQNIVQKWSGFLLSTETISPLRNSYNFVNKLILSFLWWTTVKHFFPLCKLWLSLTKFFNVKQFCPLRVSGAKVRSTAKILGKLQKILVATTHKHK